MKINKPIEKSKYIWIATAVIYILSPIDLIPNIFPFIGKIDDFVVIVLALQVLRMLGIGQNISIQKFKEEVIETSDKEMLTLMLKLFKISLI